MKLLLFLIGLNLDLLQSLNEKTDKTQLQIYDSQAAAQRPRLRYYYVDRPLRRRRRPNSRLFFVDDQPIERQSSAAAGTALAAVMVKSFAL